MKQSKVREEEGGREKEGGGGRQKQDATVGESEGGRDSLLHRLKTSAESY